MKQKLKKTLAILALGALLTAPLSKTGNAAVEGVTASGNTDISVTLPPIIILHYISEVSLSFTDISTSVDEGAGSWDIAWTDAASNVSGELTSALLDDATTEPDGKTTFNITLPNVWAVRGYSSSGTASLLIEEGNTTLENGQSEIVLSDFSVSDDEPELNGLAKGNATIGSVSFVMDIIGAGISGTYEAEGAEYTLTASAI